MSWLTTMISTTPMTTIAIYRLSESISFSMMMSVTSSMTSMVDYHDLHHSHDHHRHIQAQREHLVFHDDVRNLLHDLHVCHHILQHDLHGYIQVLQPLNWHTAMQPA